MLVSASPEGLVAILTIWLPFILALVFAAMASRFRAERKRIEAKMEAWRRIAEGQRAGGGVNCSR